MSSLSIVTVTFNRTDHLLRSALSVSLSDVHDEHLILDFGSNPAVVREQLPSDSRIRLIRCNWAGGWWLTHAYNLAFALARGEWILKLDADALLPKDFLAMLMDSQQVSGAHFFCDRLTVQDWKLPSSLFLTNGLFLVSRKAIRSVRGFNPYIQGWGWDEIDLYSRLFLAGFSSQRLPSASVKSIDHPDDMRQRVAKCGVSASRLKKAMNQKNMLVAKKSCLIELDWPDLDSYASSFTSHQQPPALQPQMVLDAVEVRDLAVRCSQTLLRPGFFRRIWWKLMSLFGDGPYATKSAKTFLAHYGIDLEIVSPCNPASS